MNRAVGHLSCLLRRHPKIRCYQRVLYHSRDGVYGCLPEEQGESHETESLVLKNRLENLNLHRLVEAYRCYGHHKAIVDPLSLASSQEPEALKPDLYGLKAEDGNYNIQDILHTGQTSASLDEVVNILEETYCGPLTAEFVHLPTLEEREWFATSYEQIKHQNLENEERVQLATLMLKSQAFDQFLATKFQSVKRYGGEGAESAMGFYQELFKMATPNNISDVIVCIAHRGRLNLLTCLLNFPPAVMFRKMKGKREFPDDVVGAGDVLSHLTSSTDLMYGDKSVHVTMLPNPSHLEAVNPVAMGKARGRMQTIKTGDYADHNAGARSGDGVLCLQIHGDGAFAAQGIISECFAIADTPHFDVGGSIHLIINNQLGYTTPADRGRSGLYASDMAKINSCPVIRVNGDYPEEVVKACRLAMAYRERFRRDIVVDLICYRTWGHNELDEPTFTQPLMYQAIRSRETIPNKYARCLKEDGICSAETLDESVGKWNNFVASEHATFESHTPKANHLQGTWVGYVQAPASIAIWETGVNSDLLRYIGAKSVEPPTDMEIHSTLQKTHIARRLQRMESGTDLDWATAETLAFGSLLAQGYNIRLSGQDVGRGTFSQRHAMLVDQKTEAVAIPLNHLSHNQTAFIEVCNSALSEEAVLGFEYGMSVEHPRRLVIWEAQFGDFFNGAQIMIDTLITGGETKWLLQSGLVLLLPHGMDGAGPEHSSCRIERFLQLTDSKEDGIDGDDVNLSVVNPSTPAQYFHLLRRQMVRPYRKPLIVAAPKMLLRHPSCTSNVPDMTEGTHFQPVLDDPQVTDPSKVTRVVLVSGKHYYTLTKERETSGATHIAIVRMEELCPFPAEQLKNKLSIYPNATDMVWSQEEHRNQGAWSFVKPRIENILGRHIRYIGRGVHATPATGVGEIHQQEVRKILEETLA